MIQTVITFVLQQYIHYKTALSANQPRSWSEVHSRPLLESLGLMVPRLGPELLVGF